MLKTPKKATTKKSGASRVVAQNPATRGCVKNSLKISPNSLLFRFYEKLLLIMPAALFFSFLPVISLGANSSMNFELSIALIWLVIFDLVGFYLLVIKNFTISLKSLASHPAYLLFPAFATFSLFWTANLLRGVLTVGIIWLVYFAIFSIFQLRASLSKKITKKIPSAIIASTLVICAGCFLQCFLDVFGVPPEVTGMCRGCTTQTFGFPHPNGFAIEPQFMGSLLLLPALFSAFRFLGGYHSASRFWQFFIISTTLFLTFSRGAIYAYIIGGIFLLIGFATLRRKNVANPGMEKTNQGHRPQDRPAAKNSTRVCTRIFCSPAVSGRRVLGTFGVVLLSFLTSLALQGFFSQISTTYDTFSTGVAKSINHLSLGIIDFRPDSTKTPDGNNLDTESNKCDILDSTSIENQQNIAKSSTFDGYVAESTEVRLSLTDSALRVWRKDPATMFFGVGIGGAGQALYSAGENPDPKEIVQNQFISILLELGIIGVISIVIAVAVSAKFIIKLRVYYLLPIIAAYSVSFLFLSGITNTLHVYLLPALLLAVVTLRSGAPASDAAEH